ncbi:hypothetical protein C8F01DRAFT_1089318 [Mycena amicta]|nr:hypothetical protein C8F01DRAFT_1089318 [Mycena amicta]
MDHTDYQPFRYVPGFPDPEFILPMKTIVGNPTPESTGDVESPKALRHMIPTPTPTLPNLLELVDKSAVFTDEQRDRIRAKPDDHLAVVPHGAGCVLLTHELQDRILEFLITLGFQGRKASLRLELPDDSEHPDAVALVLSCMNDEMKRFLPWHQTFAVSAELAFHVLPYNPRRREYFPITGIAWNNDQMNDSERSKKRILGAIRSIVWDSDHFLGLNAEIWRDRGSTGDDVSLAIVAAAILDIHFVPPSGNHHAMMILTAPTFTTEEKQYRWGRMIRRVVEGAVVDGSPLVPGMRWWSCTWCTSIFHSGGDCDFEKVEGWLGPSESNLPQDLRETWVS